MKKKSIEKIMEDFHEEYQEDPEGWSFWMSPPSESGDFYEAYIVHGDEAYFLKLDSVFTPNPLGVGTKLSIEEDQLVEDLPDFGYRKFDKEETRKFLENLPSPEEHETEEEFRKELKKSREKFAEKAINKKPVPFEPPGEKGGLAAIGPYSSENPLGYISEKQKKIKRELNRKLERKINRDHPGYY